LGLLVLISLAFGVVTLFIGKPRIRWEWLIAATAWFIGGLFASEVLWGSLTVEEIQPIIDGLAFDEALLGGLVAGVLAFLATRFLTGGSPFHRAVTP
jgi:hypothetical protein